MGRKKLISDEKLINMIRVYFTNDCGGDVNKLRYPKIADYVASNGYPGYRVESLRRNTVAREFVDSLVKTANENELTILATYKTLDIDSFLATNSTKLSLRKALMQLDCYYKTVADSAMAIALRHNELEEKCENISKRLENSKDQEKQLTSKIKEVTDANKQLKAECQGLRKIIDDYIYPEIANKLLVQEGLLRQDGEQLIDKNKLDDHMIHADTVIPFNRNKEQNAEKKSNIKIIDSLFNKLDEEV